MKAGIIHIAQVMRAAFELARARIQVGRMRTLDAGAFTPSPAKQPKANGPVELVRYSLPRVAARMPWRSDCLVQAIAGKNWLAAYGILSTLKVGVRNEGGSMESHAWLLVGDELVTGGDISSYIPHAIKQHDAPSN